MIARLLISGVAIGALAAGGAMAKTHHLRHHAMAHGMSGATYTYAAPTDPIPYSDLDHYLHASRAERRSMETAAASSSATNAAAETPAPAPSEQAAPSPTETPPTAATPPASSEPQAATPPATPSPSTTPPATPPTTQPPPQ